MKCETITFFRMVTFEEKNLLGTFEFNLLVLNRLIDLAAFLKLGGWEVIPNRMQLVPKGEKIDYWFSSIYSHKSGDSFVPYDARYAGKIEGELIYAQIPELIQALERYEIQ
jgi:hypothetical protein